MGESGTRVWVWLGLWMDIPGICCHVEGMRICWVPAGQPCCTHTQTKTNKVIYSRFASKTTNTEINESKLNSLF